MIMHSRDDKLRLYLSVATLTSLYFSYFLNLAYIIHLNIIKKREANFAKTPFRVVQY